VLVELGLGKELLAEWKRALGPEQRSHEDWYGYAELSLYMGDAAGYQRHCHELLTLFESSTDPQVCERAARSCLLSDLGPEVSARAAAMIDRALGADTTPSWLRPYLQVVRGLARYRLGDFDGAIRTLQEDALNANGPFPHLVLALSHRDAGHPAEALRSFARGLRAYEWNSLDGFDFWLYSDLRREAEGHLAGLRDPDFLATLPRAERDECLAIWSELDAALQRTHDSP
jgi:tetratricopeptide (TPR) repeat protein